MRKGTLGIIAALTIMMSAPVVTAQELPPPPPPEGQEMAPPPPPPPAPFGYPGKSVGWVNMTALNEDTSPEEGATTYKAQWDLDLVPVIEEGNYSNSMYTMLIPKEGVNIDTLKFTGKTMTTGDNLSYSYDDILPELIDENVRIAREFTGDINLVTETIKNLVRDNPEYMLTLDQDYGIWDAMGLRPGNFVNRETDIRTGLIADENGNAMKSPEGGYVYVVAQYREVNPGMTPEGNHLPNEKHNFLYRVIPENVVERILVEEPLTPEQRIDPEFQNSVFTRELTSIPHGRTTMPSLLNYASKELFFGSAPEANIIPFDIEQSYSIGQYTPELVVPEFTEEISTAFNVDIKPSSDWVNHNESIVRGTTIWSNAEEKELSFRDIEDINHGSIESEVEAEEEPVVEEEINMEENIDIENVNAAAEAETVGNGDTEETTEKSESSDEETSTTETTSETSSTTNSSAPEPELVTPAPEIIEFYHRTTEEAGEETEDTTSSPSETSSSTTIETTQPEEEPDPEAEETVEEEPFTPDATQRIYQVDDSHPEYYRIIIDSYHIPQGVKINISVDTELKETGWELPAQVYSSHSIRIDDIEGTRRIAILPNTTYPYGRGYKAMPSISRGDLSESSGTFDRTGIYGNNSCYVTDSNPAGGDIPMDSSGARNIIDRNQNRLILGGPITNYNSLNLQYIPQSEDLCDQAAERIPAMIPSEIVEESGEEVSPIANYLTLIVGVIGAITIGFVLVFRKRLVKQTTNEVKYDENDLFAVDERKRDESTMMKDSRPYGELF